MSFYQFSSSAKYSVNSLFIIYKYIVIIFIIKNYQYHMWSRRYDQKENKKSLLLNLVHSKRFHKAITRTINIQFIKKKKRKCRRQEKYCILLVSYFSSTSSWNTTCNSPHGIYDSVMFPTSSIILLSNQYTSISVYLVME